MAEYLSKEDMSTGEYISRDEALKAMQYCCESCDNYNGAMCRACDNADEMDIIIDMPSADVQPVSVIKELQEQIASVKRSVKSENSDYLTGYIAALSAVEGMIDDIQPVKHGYWEEVTDYGGWGDTHYRCSVCGEEWYLEDGKPKDNNMNFCPRYGAKMDAEPDEPWQSE